MAKKRRGNNEGSVYQRASGKWCASLTVGYDENGRRKRRYLYGATKTEVLEKLARLHADSLNGTLGEPTRTRLSEYLHRWLEDSSRNRRAPRPNSRPPQRRHRVRSSCTSGRGKHPQ